MTSGHLIHSEEQSAEQLNSTPLIISLILIILVASFIRWNLNPSENIKPSDQSHSFSAISAKQMLSEVLADELPHPLNSHEIRNTEKRLVKKLRELGYQEEIQETKICDDYKNWGVRCTQVRNVIVTINGSSKVLKNDKPTGILISAHYDSVDAGPGASDAGVAVATLLEIARLMSTQPKPKNTIVLLFNEGEEYGLLGARAFMQQHPLAKKLKLAINIEARGSKGSSVMFETGENSGWLVQDYLKHSPKVLSSSLFYEVYKSLPNDTDLTAFKHHGLQGLNFAHAEKLAHYHTPLDNLANLELSTIQHHGDNVWGVLKSIKDKNLNDKSLNETNLVYTDILGLFSIEWQENTSIVLSILLLILFVYSFSKIAKSIVLSKKSLGRGVYSFFAILIIIPIFAYLLQLGLSSFSATRSPWYINNFPMQVALWSLSTLVTLMLGRLMLKNCQPLSVLLGQVICWIILSIVTSYFVVGISYLFLIPSTISIIILLLYPCFLNADKQSTLKLHYIAFSLVITILFIPIVYTLAIMVTYQMTVAIGIMFSFVMIGLLPMLCVKENKKVKQSFGRVNKSLMISFLIGSVWTVMQPSYDTDSKQRINITYVQNGQNDAYISAGDRNNRPPKLLMEELNPPKLASIYPWTNYQTFHQPVKNIELETSKTTLTRNPSDLNSREQATESVKLAIDSSIQSDLLRQIRVYIPKKAGVNQVSLFGKSYDLKKRIPNAKGYYQFRCIGLNCQSLIVKLKKSKAGKGEILVVKILKGIPKELDQYRIKRGETAQQLRYGDQSLIISRIKI